MGLFDIPDDAKERLDALIVVGTNMATAMTALSKSVDKLQKTLEENKKITTECKCKE